MPIISIFTTHHFSPKITRIYHFFLIFPVEHDKIIHNAIGIEYILWQMDEDEGALSVGRAPLLLWLGRRKFMAVSYKKLWKLLIDRDMKKKDLCAKAGISSASVTKMGKNGHVTTEILLKICTALDCQIEDIIEFTPEDK